jgi:hypothetical protein
MRCLPRALVALFLLAGLPALADPADAPRRAGIVSHIKRRPVESSAIAAVGYSKQLRALEIEFRNRAIYRYLEVPPEVYEALIDARSKARFYDQNIRRKYRSVRVRPRAE